ISRDASEIGRNGNQLISDAQTAVQDMQAAGTALARSQDSVSRLLQENRHAIESFESTGYPQLPALMADLKQVVRRYTRLWAELSADPGRFLLRDNSAGFQP